MTGLSIGLLARRAAQVYTELHEGRDVQPAVPRVQYGDYAVWQRARLSGGALAADLDFWRRTLDGAPSALELATDHPRPAVFRYRGAGLPIELDAHVTARVRALAAEHQMTPFMVLVTALSVVLMRYSGQQDVVIGTPLASRQHPWLEPLIGFFANTLVLRADLSGDPTVPELLRRVRAACLDAYEHQDVPFERLVEYLHPRRDLSRTPLFQVMLALQNEPVPEIDLPEAQDGPVPGGQPRPRSTTSSSRCARRPRRSPASWSTTGTCWAASAFAGDGRGADGRTGSARRRAGTTCRTCRYPSRGKLARLLSGWNREPGYDPQACLHDLVARRICS